MANDMELYRAFLDIRAAAEHLLIAHNSTDYPREYHSVNALAEMGKAAEKLGFKLVPSEPAKQSEAA